MTIQFDVVAYSKKFQKVQARTYVVHIFLCEYLQVYLCGVCADNSTKPFDLTYTYMWVGIVHILKLLIWVYHITTSQHLLPEHKKHVDCEYFLLYRIIDHLMIILIQYVYIA